MNFVADLLWLFRSFYLRCSSIGSFVERDLFIRILFQVYFVLHRVNNLNYQLINFFKLPVSRFLAINIEGKIGQLTVRRTSSFINMRSYSTLWTVIVDCIVLHYMHTCIWHLRIRASSLQFRASKINMALARMDKLVKKLMSNPVVHIYL